MAKQICSKQAARHLNLHNKIILETRLQIQTDIANNREEHTSRNTHFFSLFLVGHKMCGLGSRSHLGRLRYGYNMLSTLSLM